MSASEHPTPRAECSDKPAPKEQCLVPIHSLIKQLEQMASTHEWYGELDKCDAVLIELQHVRHYQITTGSLWFPLF
jgi:hypothetical protein